MMLLKRKGTRTENITFFEREIINLIFLYDKFIHLMFIISHYQPRFKPEKNRARHGPYFAPQSYRGRSGKILKNSSEKPISIDPSVHLLSWRYAMSLMNFWYWLIESLKTMTTVLVIALAFTGIILTLFFSILKLSKNSPNFAIIFSTIVSCVLMVPVITSFNHLVTLKVEGSIIDEAKAEIKAQRAEADRLRYENKVKLLEKERLENQVVMAKQSIEIENLKTNNILLERAKLSIQSFQQIAEVAFTQANFTETLVRKEPVTPIESGWGIKADNYYDEALVVIAHDINAKFGIDLKEVKISKTEKKSVVVSGIHPKFIGADRNESKTLVKEIRRVDYKYDIPYRIRIKDKRQDLILADLKADQYEDEFQKKISEGIQLAFMDDAIIQLAENFIKIVLAPIYDSITFDNNNYRPGALPIMDYLAKEIEDNDEDKYKLLKINDQITITLEQTDAGKAKPEEEL